MHLENEDVISFSEFCDFFENKIKEQGEFGQNWVVVILHTLNRNVNLVADEVEKEAAMRCKNINAAVKAAEDKVITTEQRQKELDIIKETRAAEHISSLCDRFNSSAAVEILLEQQVLKYLDFSAQATHKTKQEERLMEILDHDRLDLITKLNVTPTLVDDTEANCMGRDQDHHHNQDQDIYHTRSMQRGLINSVNKVAELTKRVKLRQEASTRIPKVRLSVNIKPVRLASVLNPMPDRALVQLIVDQVAPDATSGNVDDDLPIHGVKLLFSRLSDIPLDMIHDQHDEVLSFARMPKEEQVEVLMQTASRKQVRQYCNLWLARHGAESHN